MSNETLTRRVLFEKTFRVIGREYIYCDTINGSYELRQRCKLINVKYDGYYVIYEFKINNGGGIGATIFPWKLIPIKNGEQ